MEKPYLSVVAVSRNDDHGGDPLRRTRLFISSLAFQAERYTLPVELILVDWNPPEGKPPLVDVLDFPVNAFFTARVIVVPPALHESFRHGGELPLFQMIGKNVGIRRAGGEFILATNIDILLDDRLFACIAKRELDSNRLYRADRYDIINSICGGDHEALQVFCRDISHQILRNRRISPERYGVLQELKPEDSSCLLKNSGAFAWAEFSENDDPLVTLKSQTPYYYLHTNGCGDFTLMHRDIWAALRGYPEFEAYSFNIDSIGCIQAYMAGFPETSFLPPLVCYHIEHAPGSGWTPEYNEKLFERITNKGIPFLGWELLEKTAIKTVCQNAGAPCLFNGERWGLYGFDLEETVFAPEGKRAINAGIAPRDFRPLAAILPFWQVDTILQNFCIEDGRLRETTEQSDRDLLPLKYRAHPCYKIILFVWPLLEAIRRMYIVPVPVKVRVVLRKLRGKKDVV